MTILTLTLRGSAREIGRQHGRQIQHLRPRLMQVMAQRLESLRRLDADNPQVLRPALAALEELDRPLLDFLHGLADELNLNFDDLLRYTLSSYLNDLRKVRHSLSGPDTGAATDGCTTWAASGALTGDGRPLLAKNRDYHRDHIALQHLARVAPADGYRFLSLGSAGSPHVFSSGVNERGLAVADTHVLSWDIGPGLPRFSLMRELLTHHADIASALDYLRSVQHMGAGTLILADAAGQLAVCESGHRRCGYLQAGPGQPLVSTNHFVTEELAGAWMEDEPPLLVGNSPARRQRVLDALSSLASPGDESWAVALMSAHGDAQNAICRHPLPDDSPLPHPSLDSSTISSVLFFPAGRACQPSAPGLRLAIGQPCTARWQEWSLASLPAPTPYHSSPLQETDPCPPNTAIPK